MSTKTDEILAKYGAKRSTTSSVNTQKSTENILAKYGVSRSGSVAAPAVSEKKEETTSVIDRVGNILKSAGTGTAAGYASALGTTQAVTGGTIRSNYLNTDIQRLENELTTYRIKAKNADNAEEQKYFLLEAGKTANALEAAKQNLKETETAGQAMQQTADRLSQTSAESAAKAKEGLGGVGSFLVDTGIAGAQMLGDIGVGLATGGSALPSMFVRSAGSSAQEARNSGATLGQQVAYGLGSGALSVATEKLSSVAAPFKKAFGEGVLDSAITKAAGRLGQTTAGKLALSALSEGGEEFVESVGQQLLKMATYDKAAVYDDAWLSDALYEAAIGAALGGVGGAVENVANRTQTAAKAQESAMPSAGTQSGSTAGKVTTTAKTGTQGVTAANAARTVDPVISGIQAGKRVDSAKLTNAQFDALAQRSDMGVDAKGQVYQMDPEQHIDVRDDGTVSSRKVNAFQFDHPEVQPYYKEAAGMLLDELTAAEKGGQIVRTDGETGVPNYTRTSRSASPRIAALLDAGGLTYAQIEQALNAIINDDGQENYAAAKRVELVLDDMLSNGYQSMYGAIPANQEYLNEKGNIPGSQAGMKRESQIPDALDNLGSARGGFDPFTAAQNQYGTLPEGENAVRPDDVPVSTTGTDRVSQSVVTAKGAAVTPDEFVPLLENQTVKGEFSFIPISDSETVQKAETIIMREGWPDALKNWTNAAKRGKVDEVMVAEGAILYNNAVNQGRYQEAMDILSDYASIVRTGARALQAARILKTLTPETRLYMINKDIQRMVDDLGLSRNITLPNNLVQAYMSAKTDAAINDAVGDIQQYVADQLPTYGIDLWNALRYTNMLGNFNTPLRNTIGNVGMKMLSKVENDVAVLGQAITRGKYGKTRTLTVSKDMMQAAKADAANVGDLLFGNAKYTLDNQSSGSFMQGVKEKQTVFKQDVSLLGHEVTLPNVTAPVLKAAETYRKGTDAIMNNNAFGDKAFLRSAYARALGGYLEANGYSAAQLQDTQWREINRDVLDNARAFAIKQAQEQTFRDNNWISDMVSNLGRGRGSNALTRAVSEGVLPFRRTPANVFVRAWEYSPLGFADAIVDAGRAAAGSEKVSGATVIEDIAKAVTGSSVFALGMVLARLGMLRGADDEDDDQAAYDDLLGHQAYSVELPDGTSFTLDWLTPTAIPLFMGANLERLRQEDGNISFGDLISVVGSNSGPLMEMSMLSGINDMLENVKYAEDAGIGQMVMSAGLSYLIQALTNSLVSQLERSFEDESTMNYVDREDDTPAWLQKDIGNASRKVPGWDYNQTAYIDAWGREDDRGSLAQRMVNNLLNPAYMSQVDVDAVEQELQRVKDATGNTSVFPDRAEKSVTIDDKTRYLTAEQYDSYARDLGQTRYELVKEATESSAYKDMSDEDKAEFISMMYSVAKAQVLQDMFSDYEPSSQLTKYLNADQYGISPAEFYAYTAAKNDLQGDKDKNGNTISGSLKAKVIDLIDDQRLTAKQKDWLYLDAYQTKNATVREMELVLSRQPWNK